MTRVEAAANLSGFVRNLGAFEEIRWPYNQSGSRAGGTGCRSAEPTLLLGAHRAEHRRSAILPVGILIFCGK